MKLRRTWDVSIGVAANDKLPPFLKIAHALAADIRRGRFRAGERLPGSRRLARTLHVHRNTVLAAISELAAEGLIETAPGRGTFVARVVRHERGRPMSRRLQPRAYDSSRVAFEVPEPPAPYRPAELPAWTLKLSTGAPDVRLVPARAIGRAFRRVLALHGPDLFAYGEPEGHLALRTALAAMLANTRALTITAADVLVTQGSQMALTLVARALLRPGQAVAVEELGYRPAWEAFRATGVTVVPVPVDIQGMDIRALRELAGRMPLRAVYVTPHHQYPTTVTLSADRRVELLELARAQKIAIIEDDYDHEFHYDDRPILPLASTDPGGHVIYVGTLSKVLAPGIRCGYIVAPHAVIRSATAIRSLLDIQGDRATEAAVAALLEHGEVQRHIARVRTIYADRRQVLAQSLRSAFGGDVEFSSPAGGMALWVKWLMDEDFDAWAKRSLEKGVAWYPGRRYAFDGKANPFARLNFASLDERELPEAVRRLAAARKR